MHLDSENWSVKFGVQTVVLLAVFLLFFFKNSLWAAVGQFWCVDYKAILFNLIKFTDQFSQKVNKQVTPFLTKGKQNLWIVSPL